MTKEIKPVLLQVLKTGHKDPFDFDFVDKPGPETVLQALGELIEM